MSSIVSKLSEIKYLLIILAYLCARSETILSQTFPSGFSQVQLTTGITNPTCMAFANDGSLNGLKQAGQLASAPDLANVYQ